MMAHVANGFIGLRVPELIKRDWMRQAKDDGRSLSNWLIRQIQEAERIKAQLAAQEAPPRRRHVA